jgi:hypothetical protein
MLNRLNLSCFRGLVIEPSLRPRINEPNMDRKTRADIRREILGKLTVRLRNLNIHNE